MKAGREAPAATLVSPRACAIIKISKVEKEGDKSVGEIPEWL